ncbi:hypothetical protein T06_8469 [Trichinella sp. T6]|nr:hypothetical protein T06_8469 [Trichinella sp. T6]
MCTVMRLLSLIGTACRRVRTARPRSCLSARVDGRYRNQTLPAVPTSGQPATPPRFTEVSGDNFNKCPYDQKQLFTKVKPKVKQCNKKLESLYLTYHNFFT